MAYLMYVDRANVSFSYRNPGLPSDRIVPPTQTPLDEASTRYVLMTIEVISSLQLGRFSRLES